MTEKPYCGVHGEPIKGNDCWNCVDALELRAKCQTAKDIIKMIDRIEDWKSCGEPYECHGKITLDILSSRIKSEYGDEE